MADIVERLQFWQTVYPEDMEKEEGNLYVEARQEILRLRSLLGENTTCQTGKNLNKGN